MQTLMFKHTFFSNNSDFNCLYNGLKTTINIIV